jgi:hypothetical protein
MVSPWPLALPSDNPINSPHSSTNGTTSIKNVNNCLDTNIYSYLETPGGQSSNLYLNVVHFFKTSVN